MFDVIIKNGWIADGSGAPLFRGDVGIKDGRIASVGQITAEAGAERIEADEWVVAPGFIDIHSHDDLYVLEDERTEAKVRQGVTTTVIGNCGFGLYPVSDGNRGLFYEYAHSLFGEPQGEAFGFASAADFFQMLERRGSVLNVASLTAHGAVRIAVMGFEQRAATENELARMKALVRESMASGSAGLSLGLIYPPGSYASFEELVELGKVVAEAGGILTSHIRNEANFLLESVSEMLRVAETAQVPLEISHLKAIGAANAGQALQAVRRIAESRRRGIDVTYDQYPYTAGSTTATTLLPPWALEGGLQRMLERIKDPPTRSKIREDIVEGIPGSSWETMWKLIGWDNIMICSVGLEANKRYEGRFLDEASAEHGREPVDFLLDLLFVEEGDVMIITFLQDEQEMERVMTYDIQMFGTDGLPVRGKRAHPRLYGTYPRVLGMYVREKRVLSLEQAIHKMTGLPARRIGLRDRGRIRMGMAADIAIFDRHTIRDAATYHHPTAFPEGIKTVIVNGRVALDRDGRMADRPGRPLRLTNR